MSATVAILQAILGQVPGLRLAFLFGSMATGNANEESDVDVAVLGDKPLSYALRQRLIAEIGERLDRPVDLVDLYETPEPVTGEAIAGIRLLGDATAFAELLVRHLVNVEDFIPLQERILRERRAAWIGE